MRLFENAFVQIQKMDGATGAGLMNVGDTLLIPAASALPSNPDNIVRPDLIEPSLWVTHEFQGKKSPSLLLTFPFKASYCTVPFFNDLLLNRTSNNTSGFHIRVSDGTTALEYHTCRCSLFNIVMTAAGIVMVTLGFTVIAGDSEVATGASWPAVSLDLGQITDVTKMVWSVGASDVLAANLTVAITQQRVYRMDGSLYAARIQSRKARGGIMVQQDADAATVPSNSLVARVGSSGAGNGVQITMDLSRNAFAKPIVPDEGEGITATRDFALAKLSTGGAAIAFANW